MIEVKRLHKSFGPKGSLEVLKGIDQTIQKGEKVVIIGPSGSGKSTFLRCLNMLETPTSGEIYYNKQLITDRLYDINKLRMNIGMVFQHFNLFPHLTILQNITL
ncbi:MAG TPA: ATP-binding cassette domain-containing protein, partial [Clostridia bacterium]|nr:ATP-binding cassette domain-containing protein [Clostridia bacterium]